MAVTLVDFTGTGGAKRGSYPEAALVQGADGNFYGSTSGGGAMGQGTVFRMTPAGAVTTLVDFTLNGATNRGAYPQGALVRATDGNFYGTTQGGGTSGAGTVFRMTPAGALVTLVDFTGTSGANRGSQPYAALVQATDGNFYGTTRLGGTSNLGTVFRMTPIGALATLVDFTGTSGANRGSQPYAALVQGPDGNFYGTTSRGGLASNDMGTVFRMTPGGILTPLVEFRGGISGPILLGGQPFAALTLGTDGNFYGTTVFGGMGNRGTIFRMTPAGVLTTLVEIGYNGGGESSYPYAGLVRGADGDFYGTTYDSDTVPYVGTVFRMTPAGAFATLVTFPGNGSGPNRGASPNAGLVQGSDGSFYGTTELGGTSDLGTVFVLQLRADGSTTQLISVVPETGGTRVRWQATAGQASRVQYSTGLTGAWQNFTGTVTASPGGVAEYLDTTTPRPAKRFYRLVTPP